MAMERDTYNYGANYILLFLDNLDLDNYKIATNKGITLFCKITCWYCCKCILDV